MSVPAPYADSAGQASGPAHPPEPGPEDGRSPGAQPDGVPPAGPGGPAPLGVPREPTGDAGVDAGLARLADADHLATDGHIEVFEDVHRGLRDALAALDAHHEAPVPGPRS
jgi:hypothetical protein